MGPSCGKVEEINLDPVSDCIASLDSNYTIHKGFERERERAVSLILV